MLYFQSKDIPKHIQIIILQRRYHRHRILGGLDIGQNPQDHALLPILNVDHAELALHSLHVFGFDHGLPYLAFDLAGQLVGRTAVRDHALLEHDGLAGDELHVGNHRGGDDDGFVEDNAGKE